MIQEYLVRHNMEIQIMFAVLQDHPLRLQHQNVLLMLYPVLSALAAVRVEQKPAITFRQLAVEDKCAALP